MQTAGRDNDVAFGYSLNTMNNKKKNVLQEHCEFVEEISKYVVDVLKSELQLHTHLQDRLAEDRPYYRLPIFEISGRIFQKLQALTVRGTQALVSFAPLAFKLFCAARQNAVLRRSPFPSP